MPTEVGLQEANRIAGRARPQQLRAILAEPMDETGHVVGRTLRHRPPEPQRRHFLPPLLTIHAHPAFSWQLATSGSGPGRTNGIAHVVERSCIVGAAPELSPPGVFPLARTLRQKKGEGVVEHDMARRRIGDRGGHPGDRDVLVPPRPRAGSRDRQPPMDGGTASRRNARSSRLLTAQGRKAALFVSRALSCAA